MQSLIKSLERKCSRLLWYVLDTELPKRSEAAYFNFCIHTELFYEKKNYDAVLNFSKNFRELTGKKITLCISTPECHLVKAAMLKNEFSEKTFTSRVMEIARFAEVGYHGHFYDTAQEGLIQISGGHYSKDIVVSQIKKEMAWFGSIGIRPRIYVAGWWFMTSDIVLELECSGIEVDVSMRRGKNDTFGGRYLADDTLPNYGKPFILPPSKNIIEIQSIFGPVMPSSIMKGHLSQYLKSDTEDSLFFIFPLHDWDVPRYYRNIWSNVKELCRFKESVGWMDISDMRKVYLGSKAEDKVERI